MTAISFKNESSVYGTFIVSLIPFLFHKNVLKSAPSLSLSLIEVDKKLCTIQLSYEDKTSEHIFPQ